MRQTCFHWILDFNLECSAFNCYLDEDDNEDDNGNDSMTETDDSERMIESNENYDVLAGKSSFYIFGKFLRASR